MGTWDEEVDVLVVGSGAGALTAALRAHDLGGRTLIIEKTDRYGGASAMGSCLLWIPNNHLMPSVGIEDSPEEAWDYLKETTAGLVSDDRLQAYLDNSLAALEYLCEKTRAVFVPQPAYPDYYPVARGSKPGGRSIEPAHFDARRLGDEFLNMRDQNLQMQVMGRLAMTALEAQAVLTGQPGSMGIFFRLILKYALDIPFRFKSRRDRNCAMGNALIGMLRLSLMDRDVPLWLNTPARELIVEEGRVVGASVEKDGRPLRVRARRGVILAAGGFEGNQAMREKHLPHPTHTDWTCANAANTGEVIEMGQAIGAGVDLMDDAWWGPVNRAPSDEFARITVIEKSLPGGMLVNRRGERFTNDAGPYIEIVKAMYASHSEESPCVPAYLVFDATFRKKYICGPMLQGSVQPDWMVQKLFKQQYVKKSNTLEGLARKVGFDAATLRATVAKVGEYARTGKDLDFGRGDNIYDCYYGDSDVKPNPCLAPIETPPFYSIEIFPGELGTKGGLKVDASARVLTDSEDVIPGLYAVGNCSSSVMGNSYPGAGATIGPGAAFGFAAASDAMSD